MRHSQDEIFAAFEGNNWFERNKPALEHFDPETDFPVKLLDLYRLHPHNILEVGAANGVRLALISGRYDARAVAVEPSKEAILNGKARFPNVEFVQGIACEIPLQDHFDLIIVNFVFHWIERNSLLRSVAEIDRLLLKGGFLIIGDFYPSNLIKTRYHHLAEQEIYTYKQNYAATFIASGLYQPVVLLTGDASSKTLNAEVNEDQRVGTWLLRKTFKDLYVEGSFRC
jgi:SAM-dependent methyltransferase